jgi:hypothetical protein
VFIALLYLLIALLMDVQVFAGAAVSVALAGGLVAFAKAKQPAGWLEALALGIPHAAAHVGAVLLLGLADFTLLWIPFPFWIPFPGYPIGLTIFVLYLLLANRTDRAAQGLKGGALRFLDAAQVLVNLLGRHRLAV